jgi:hypothetical protein
MKSITLLICFVVFLLPPHVSWGVDYTGFWKGDCSDAFGIQIKPAENQLYSVSFCGPGGCFSPGEWRPNTTIVNDPKYRVIDDNTIEIKVSSGWDRYLKCTTDTNPVLDYSTMKDSQKSGRSKIKYMETYKGLPDYDKNTPFTNMDRVQHETLRKALANIMPSDKRCKAGSVLVWKAPKYSEDTSGEDWRVELSTNICNQNKLSSIKKLIISLAPSLNMENMTAWLTDMDGDKEPDLIVGYMDISKDELKYPYLSLWRLKYEKGKYKAYYAGPFLNGTFHAIQPFGEKSKNKTVFVKHASCIECEPILYLTALDFDAGDDARAYEFTYNEKHEGFRPRIEYELPGMGHTVEAKVETRILSPSVKGPHLLQYFDMEEQPDEWWAFTCLNYRCDYKMYLNKPPDDFKKLWEKAKRL